MEMLGEQQEHSQSPRAGNNHTPSIPAKASSARVKSKARAAGSPARPVRTLVAPRARPGWHLLGEATGGSSQSTKPRQELPGVSGSPGAVAALAPALGTQHLLLQG